MTVPVGFYNTTPLIVKHDLEYPNPQVSVIQSQSNEIKRPQYTHPFLLHLYELKVIDEEAWVRNDAPLINLKSLALSGIQEIKKILITPFCLRINYKDKTYQHDIPLFEILQFLFHQGGNKNVLSGGYLQYLLGSKWYLECGAKLVKVDIEQLKKWINPTVLNNIDAERSDIDLRHLRFNTKEDPQIVLRSLMTFLANRIDPKLKHDNNFHDAIKKCFSCHTHFILTNGVIDLNAIALSGQNRDGRMIDIEIASEMKTDALLTTQKIKMDLQPWFLSRQKISGEISDDDLLAVYQAIIDELGEVLHFSSTSHSAWIRGLARQMNPLSYSQPFPDQIYTNLSEYAALHKSELGSPYAYLIQEYARKHGLNQGSQLFILACNASTDLMQHRVLKNEIYKLWKNVKLNELLHPLNIIHESILELSFELVASIIHLKSLGMEKRVFNGQNFVIAKDAHLSLKILCDSLLQIDASRNKMALNHLNKLLMTIEYVNPPTDRVLDSQDCTRLILSEYPEVVEIGLYLKLNAVLDSTFKNEVITWLGDLYLAILKLKQNDLLRLAPLIEKKLLEIIPDLPQKVVDVIKKGDACSILLAFVETKLPPCLIACDNIAFKISDINVHHALMQFYLKSFPGRALKLLLKLESSKQSLGPNVAAYLVDIIEAFHKAPLEELNLERGTLLSKATLSVMQNYPESRQALEIKLRALLERALNQEKVVSIIPLFQLFTRVDILSWNNPSTISMWLRLCEVLFNDNNYGFQHAFDLWNQGEKRIWQQYEINSEEFFPFIINFVEALLKDESDNYGLFAYRILQKLPQKFPEAYHKNFEDLRTLAEKKSGQMPLERRKAENALKALCKPCENPEECKSNIVSARLLITGAPFKEIYKDDPYSLLELHTMVLEIALKQDIEPHVLFGLIESAIVTFKLIHENSRSQSFYYVFINCLPYIQDHPFPNSLKLEFQHFHSNILRYLILNQSFDSILNYFTLLSFQNMIFQISSELYLNGYLQTLEILIAKFLPETKMCTNVRKAFEYIWETRLRISDPNYHQFLDPCIAIVNHLSRCNLYADAALWMEYVVLLIIKTDQPIPLKILDNVVSLFPLFEKLDKQDQLFQILAKFQEFTEQLEAKLFHTVMTTTDCSIETAPRLCGQILLNNRKRQIYLRPSANEIRISNLVIHKIFAVDNVSEAAIAMGIDLLRMYPRECNETFELILNKIGNTHQYFLKFHVWKVFRHQFHETLIRSQFPIILNATVIKCWHLSQKIFKELVNPAKDLPMIDEIIENLSFYMNNPQIVLKNQLQPIPNIDLDLLFHTGMVLVTRKNLKTQLLLAKLVDVYENIYHSFESESRRQVLEKIDENLAFKLCHAKDVKLFTKGCIILLYLFMTPIKNMQSRINLLGNYLQAYKCFQGQNLEIANFYLFEVVEELKLYCLNYDLSKIRNENQGVVEEIYRDKSIKPTNGPWKFTVLIRILKALCLLISFKLLFDSINRQRQRA